MKFINSGSYLIHKKVTYQDYKENLKRRYLA